MVGVDILQLHLFDRIIRYCQHCQICLFDWPCSYLSILLRLKIYKLFKPSCRLLIYLGSKLVAYIDYEARRISSLHQQLSQANVNVDRLRRDMHTLASQQYSRNCAPQQPHDVDQEALFALPSLEPMDSTTEEPPAGRPGLICSPIEQEDEGLDAN